MPLGVTSRPERIRALAGALVLGLAAAPCVADSKDLVALLVGEYNNNEQVWQREIDGVSPHPRRHWRFRARDDMGLDLAVGPGQATPDTVGWLISFDDDAQDLVSEFVGASRCRYLWRAQEAGYGGHVLDGDCAGLPAGFAVDAQWLTSIWPSPDGERVEHARRVCHYTGWVALRRSRLDPDAAPDDHVFVRGARWHDEGFVFPVLDEGRPTGYAVELARLTYQNTRTAVLKLGVIDMSTGETLSYSWAAPGAERIGINLRWIQAGLTRERDAGSRPERRP